MKAIICTKYGAPEVLQLQDVEKPNPRKNEICIRIHATTVTSSDCIVRGFKLPKWSPLRILMGLVLGFGKPRNPILGMVASGEVDSIGEDVKRFKAGDQVFTFTVQSSTKMRSGTYAEYICVPEDWLVLEKSSEMSYEVATAIPYGGTIALHFLQKGDIQNRKNVLIIGASGTVGTTAVQLAKYYGATVTGVCSTANVELVKSLGANKVIDYTKEEYSDSSEQFDLILYAVPLLATDKRNPKSRAKSILTSDGLFISTHKGSPIPNMDDLVLLKNLVESGSLNPVIGKTFPLEKTAEAHEYVETGHKTGNVIITVN